MTEPSKDITVILRDWNAAIGTPQCDEIFVTLYDDLRRIADHQMAQEHAGHTLTGTALVHEVFIKLINSEGCNWENRRHFFDVAAKVMRHTLVDHSRKKNSQKRGGEFQRTRDVALTELSAFSAEPATTLDLDTALEALANHSYELAKIVELRFFCNMTHQQIADLLEMSEVTIRRRWAYARAWLNDHLQSKASDGQL